MSTGKRGEGGKGESEKGSGGKRNLPRTHADTRRQIVPTDLVGTKVPCPSGNGERRKAQGSGGEGGKGAGGKVRKGAGRSGAGEKKLAADTRGHTQTLVPTDPVGTKGCRALRAMGRGVRRRKGGGERSGGKRN